MLLGFISAFQRKKKSQAEGNGEKQWIFYFNKRDCLFWQTTLWNEQLYIPTGVESWSYWTAVCRNVLFRRGGLVALACGFCVARPRREVWLQSTQWGCIRITFSVKANTLNTYFSQLFMSLGLFYEHAFPPIFCQPSISFEVLLLFVVTNKIIKNLWTTQGLLCMGGVISS